MVCAGSALKQGYGVVALTIALINNAIVSSSTPPEKSPSRLGISQIVLPIDLRSFGGSALTSDIAVPKDGTTEGIPVTDVPARNTVFLSLAHFARRGCGSTDIFIGVNALDYSGIPTYRPAFIERFEQLANVATRGGASKAINCPQSTRPCSTLPRPRSPARREDLVSMLRSATAVTTRCLMANIAGFAVTHADCAQRDFSMPWKSRIRRLTHELFGERSAFSLFRVREFSRESRAVFLRFSGMQSLDRKGARPFDRGLPVLRY